MHAHNDPEITVDPITGNTHPDPHARVPRWSLTMAFWSIVSAMFWLYIAQASTAAVGTTNTIIGWILSTFTYAALCALFARRAIQTGETVSHFSRQIFGSAGGALAALLFGVTAVYYAVFEGSVIAAALEQSLGGDIELWYLVVAVCSVPLVIGGVQNWLDKLNGILLPLYIVGMAAVLIATTVKQGYPHGWLSQQAPTGLHLPGWLLSYLLYMGVWVMVMYTMDFARHGRREDITFHSHVTFGWVFYLIVFPASGLCGIYLVSAWDTGTSETGLVTAVLNSLGIFGLLHILVSQVRIQSANYFAAANNLRNFFEQVTGRAAPRLLFVFVSVLISYLFMLTDVLSYLVRALAWQGIFVVAWVFMAVMWLVFSRDRRSPGGTRVHRQIAFGWPAAVWLTSSVIGICLVEQRVWPQVSALGPIITIVVAGVLYLPSILSRKTHREDEPRDAVMVQTQL
ncbi:purine-cytosine permease family protein [Rhodococcus koreensis]